MAKKGAGWFGWLASFLIAIALINWGFVAWTDFNLVEWMSFGYDWIAKTTYTVIAVLGLVGLIQLLRKTF